MPAKKPRLGRPPKKPSDQRRHILSVRFRDKTWERLQKAAEMNRRSLSQEVEFRVEQALMESGYASSEEMVAQYRADRRRMRELFEKIERRDSSVQAFIDMAEKKK